MGQLFDPVRIDVAVLEKPLESQPGDLAADRIETGEDDRPGLIIHEELDARQLLEAPDVLPLVADDPPLHLLVRNRERRDAPLGAPLRGGPLDRQGDDLACLDLRLLLRLLARLADHPGGLEPHLLADVMEKHLPGVLSGQPGDLAELLVELVVELLHRRQRVEQPVGVVADVVDELAGFVEKLPGFESDDFEFWKDAVEILLRRRS